MRDDLTGARDRKVDSRRVMGDKSCSCKRLWMSEVVCSVQDKDKGYGRKTSEGRRRREKSKEQEQRQGRRWQEQKRGAKREEEEVLMRHEEKVTTGRSRI